MTRYGAVRMTERFLHSDPAKACCMSDSASQRYNIVA